MPLFSKTYGNTDLIKVQTPSVLESVITVTGDTIPTSTTHDIIAAKFSVTNNIGTDPGTENLVAYYKLDEISGDSGDLVLDSSGYNRHGTLIAGTTGSYEDAVVNNGYHFTNDSDSGIILPLMSTFTTCSLCAWVNLDTLDPVDNYPIIIQLLVGGTSERMQLHYANGADTIKCYIDDGAGGVTVTPNDVSVAEQWYFVIATYDGSTLQMYVDGVLQNQTQNRTLNGWTPNQNAIGIDADGSGGEFEGIIDEVRIYNKVLTANEALFLYSNPPGKIVGTQNPTGNANINPLEVSGGGIVFNELASAPTVGGANKGILYLKDTGLYFVDKDGNDVTAASYEGGSWLDVEGDSGIWHPGPVGIGDSTPTSMLDVNGNIRSIGSATPSSGIGVEIVYTGTGRIFAYDRDGSTWEDLVLGLSPQLTLASDGESYFNYGNVGVGLGTGLTAKLEVTGTNMVEILSTTTKSDGNTNAIQGNAETSNTGNNRAFYASSINAGAGNAFSFYGNAGIFCNIDSVGIGTDNPYGKVMIRVTSDNATLSSVTDSLLFQHQSGSYTVDNYYGVLGWARANSNGGTLGAAIAPVMDVSGGTKALTFHIGSTLTEYMRLDSSGKLGLGAVPLRKFQVSLDNGTLPAETDAGETGILVNNNSATGDKCAIAIIAGNLGASHLYFGDVDDENAGSIWYNHNGNEMYARTNGSGTDLYLNSSGYVGVGSTPSFPLDVATILGATNARFGSTRPVCIISSDPNIGFNAYYNGGWKVGTGTYYTALIGFGPTSGNLAFKTSTGTAATDAAANGLTDAILIDKNQNVGLGTTATVDEHLHIEKATDPTIKLEKTGTNAGSGLILYNSTDASIDFIIE